MYLLLLSINLTIHKINKNNGIRFIDGDGTTAKPPLEVTVLMKLFGFMDDLSSDGMGWDCSPFFLKKCYPLNLFPIFVL